MTVNFKPIMDRILIKTEVTSSVSAGGIVLAGAPQQMDQGIIVAIGTGVRNTKTGELEPMMVEVGNKVMFARGCGQQVELEHVKYQLIREADILGIVG